MANVVWKYHQRGELTLNEAQSRSHFISQVSVRLASSADLIVNAMEIACKQSIAVYDALYVQLAISEGIPFVTVDDHLLRKLGGQNIQCKLFHLQDLPSSVIDTGSAQE